MEFDKPVGLGPVSSLLLVPATRSLRGQWFIQPVSQTQQWAGVAAAFAIPPVPHQVRGMGL